MPPAPAIHKGAFGKGQNAVKGAIPTNLLRSIQSLTSTHGPKYNAKDGKQRTPIGYTPTSPPKYTRLSKPVTNLLDPNTPKYDVLIVGSGYGGGVLASRLSRAGKKVCVLERGKERWPGEYPNTFAELLTNAQVRSAQVPQLGPKDAFFDFRLEEGAYIWVGCGLGGGSLVNSGVCIQPDMRVFDEKVWPDGIRTDKDTKLKDGFERAKTMLSPAQYPNQAKKPLPRITRFQEAAAHLRDNGYPQAVAKLADVDVSFEAKMPNAQGVEQPACTLCGDCNTGCNVGAKNTVLMNYLPDAVNFGADIYTGVEARYIEQAGGSWIMHCELLDPSFNPPMKFSVTADMLVLAAGTLGTSEILLRSRQRESLTMSTAVGLNFGADGDFFRPSFNGQSKVNSIGYGADKDGKRRKAEDDSVGPCITSVLDLRDPKADVKQGIILEDIGIGGALAEASNVMFSKLSDAIGQPTETDPKKLAAAKERESKSASDPWAPDGAFVNSICWGGMSFDSQDGKMELNADQVRVKWPTAAGGPNPPKRSDALAKACCETPTIKSVFCTDPLESFLGERGTIHPLGGCCLADDASTGGCNHKGQLFSSSSGAAVHNNLYVVDGAAIPSSLGVNPFFTISAVAERCAAYIAEDHGWTIDYDSTKWDRAGGEKKKHAVGDDYKKNNMAW
jgi:cholesterol oxidase